MAKLLKFYALHPDVNPGVPCLTDIISSLRGFPSARKDGILSLAIASHDYMSFRYNISFKSIFNNSTHPLFSNVYWTIYCAWLRKLTTDGKPTHNNMLCSVA